MNTEHIVYKVGGHAFALDIPADYLSDELLSSYAPFRIDGSDDDMPLFTLTLVSKEDVAAVTDDNTIFLEDEDGRMAISRTERGELSIALSPPDGPDCCMMSVNEDFRSATAWIGGEGRVRRYAFDSAMMLLYTFATSSHATLLVHASVIEHEEKGYMFLGRSGTGKSTHSRLWMENVVGARLLNDDNPVLRVTDGNVSVYGSPWSGKTPCYIARRVPVASIVRLHQAPRNHISLLAGAKAYAALLPSCSSMKWDHEMARQIHETVREVIARVPVFDLKCLPESEAAFLCLEAAKRVNKE